MNRMVNRKHRVVDEIPSVYCAVKAIIELAINSFLEPKTWTADTSYRIGHGTPNCLFSPNQIYMTNYIEKLHTLYLKLYKPPL